MGQDQIDHILDRYVGQDGALIQLLLDVQQELNWVPKEAVQRITERLQIPLSQVYRVASFYNSISLELRGRHTISVCLGTACQVRNGPRVMDRIRETLGINPGETTADMRFTLQRVNCLGCCALGPVIVVDGQYHGQVPPAKVEKILQGYD